MELVLRPVLGMVDMMMLGNMSDNTYVAIAVSFVESIFSVSFDDFPNKTEK
ncbi:hypothetical protein JTF06_11635 [Desemzia sp. RIT804]|uniref:hypothetical protein n=1 Tax=Desemzia sp. RIT 804 TaxID=2810209 RepID=UPI0019521199|nr:hypothetical protein [Desemzia sp. RIT 804]MBM6615535.1 hypothetical protein [Desemzia sp. RIT 804]